MSSSTKLLKVSFMVRVLRNRDASGAEGFDSREEQTENIHPESRVGGDLE